MGDYNEFRDEFEVEGTSISPNRLRGLVNKLIASTDIKITEFQRIIGVNANSYGRFMTGKYKDQWAATQNGTYFAAAYFFFREKKLGKLALGKTRAHGAATAAAAGGGSTAGAAAALPPIPDVSGIETDGETYLTPAETRKALREALKKHGESVATLARLASVPYQSFNNFMKAAGDFGGSENQAYHPAAALAEKLRIAADKPKSKKRKAIEAEADASGARPRLGLDPNGKYWAMPGAFMTKDSLGRHTLAYTDLSSGR